MYAFEVRGASIAVGGLVVAAGVLLFELLRPKGPQTKPVNPKVSVAHPANSSLPSVRSVTGLRSSSGRVRYMDAKSREYLLAQILAARARRGESSTAAPGSPGAPREFTSDYIQAQVRDVVPLIAECYEKELVDHPHLGGTLLVEFTIGGEPGVGAVIEDIRIDPETSTITDPEMIECVRETMASLELDAPSEGGKVLVRYPFGFSPELKPAK